jgi:CubicO group peptidase (beta-lactamase class C family)
LTLSARPVFGQTRKAPLAKAPTPQPELRPDPRIAEILAPVRDEFHIPGIAAAVVANDRVASVGSLGIRKIGSTEPFKVTDQVHLGSCTKAMTATLIGMLVEEKKVAWGTRLRDIFPSASAIIHPDFETVTLGHLLTHRAGLPRDVDWWQLAGKTTTAKRKSLLNTVFQNPPLSSPGSKYLYSNVGYALIGLVAEHITGQSWESLMTKRLFEPLGMTSAGFGSPGHAGKVDQPWGHRAFGGNPNEIRATQFDNPPVMGPAGTVHCSIVDWARFALLHVRSERGKPNLLTRATLRDLHTPPPGFSYACGWLVSERSSANGATLFHNGSNMAWFSAIWLAPALNVAVVAATNLGTDAGSKASDQAVSELRRSINYLTQLAGRAR